MTCRMVDPIGTVQYTTDSILTSEKNPHIYSRLEPLPPAFSDVGARRLTASDGGGSGRSTQRTQSSAMTMLSRHSTDGDGWNADLESQYQTLSRLRRSGRRSVEPEMLMPTLPPERPRTQMASKPEIRITFNQAPKPRSLHRRSESDRGADTPSGSKPGRSRARGQRDVGRSGIQVRQTQAPSALNRTAYRHAE
eukprot:2188828-Rhodomonas_salina.1